MSENKAEKNLALESIVSTAIQIPGVKVIRDKFLAETFATENISIQDVLDLGPVAAGLSQERLTYIANKHILIRTSQSSIASFVAGIPGGLAMAATIPADIMQFFGMALKLAQELSYLYGAKDLWQDGQVDNEKVQNQLLLYCGVMFSVSGAVSGVRVLSTQVAKTTLKKLPQKALTKTFWYPILKKISKKVFDYTLTKNVLAKNVSKAIPVIGGVISGGINFASMMPMAHRLMDAFDSAAFDYTQEEFEQDIIDLENLTEEMEDAVETKSTKEKIAEKGKQTIDSLSGIFTKRKNKSMESSEEDSIDKIKKLAELKEAGIISDTEFEEKKAELLAKI